ncbi:formate dehydrogenase accessory sulfurtransferase FdhD [Siculibacillus lacustris]|uniref:Sulfur carrier protein FdhD n=1 Tax=Siculibacillus lacustris TaxID=1549641 RepID=A0A4Q9VY57_9HYPH|nr:formate dehydrogenase accessory sulfurtransferase FdhD [Siculibacillus lacustris]TBW40318.1 formate dehydrogenase accessory sulfurtransferase FdhD [Siculibacillus lacustris]
MTEPSSSPSVPLPTPEAIRSLGARRITAGGVAQRAEAIAAEVPVALIYNGQSFAVMLATPADLEDFARGFSVTEAVVGAAADIRAIEVRAVDRGIELRVTIDDYWALALAARRRSLAGRSGCGLCGVDTFAEALRPVARVASRFTVGPAALRKAIADMPAHQTINAQVGAVHGAAFVGADGSIRALREDIGRHNALDKLIGAVIDDDVGRGDGFVLVSSRCSYEMVHKTAVAGIPLIAAVSAPTSLAIELAEKVGVTLVGFAREGRFTVYAGGERIAPETPAA